MEHTIDIPVTVLDDNCKTCTEFDIHMTGSNDLWAGCKLLVHDVHAECSHLRLCKYLKNRHAAEEE